MIKRQLWIGTVIIALIVVVAYIEHSKRKALADEVVIKVSDATTTPNNWDLVTRMTGRDILKEEGIKVQLVPGIGGVGPRFQALLTGQLDIEGGAWVGWVNVIARGGKIKAVYAQSAITKEMSEKSGILVLEKSEIRTIKDLKGKTIAVNTLGLAADYAIKRLLQKNGLSTEDVQLLSVPSANMEQVLRTKQVDAAAEEGTSNGGSWFDLARDKGGVRVIPGTSLYEIHRQYATTAVAGFRQDFIQAHPDVVRRYVTAIEKAKRIVWSAYQKDPENVRAVYAEIAREKGGNPLLGKYYLAILPEATFIKDQDVQYWIDVLVTKGELKLNQVKPSDIYTSEFNPYNKKPVERK
jgi:ABC-type nitrate/sulfonate/bicarbonate transport system substrate-binding protein